MRDLLDHPARQGDQRPRLRDQDIPQSGEAHGDPPRGGISEHQQRRTARHLVQAGTTRPRGAGHLHQGRAALVHPRPAGAADHDHRMPELHSAVEGLHQALAPPPCPCSRPGSGSPSPPAPGAGPRGGPHHRGRPPAVAPPSVLRQTPSPNAPALTKRKGSTGPSWPPRRFCQPPSGPVPGIVVGDEAPRSTSCVDALRGG